MLKEERDKSKPRRVLRNYLKMYVLEERDLINYINIKKGQM